MNDNDYLFLLKFVRKQILTEVDPSLRRIVHKLMAENRTLRERISELGGEQLKEEYWDNWEIE